MSVLGFRGDIVPDAREFLEVVGGAINIIYGYKVYLNLEFR